MFKVAKIGGVWQIWNMTCDGSIIVGNGHRNMGFFERYDGKKVKALINALETIKPIFSLNKDLSKIILESDLKQNPKGFHVFDYVQLQEAGIDISIYIQSIDFRLGSFVVFDGNLFTAERIADELDTYPGHPFLIRYLNGQKPAPIEPSETFEVIIPSLDDVKNKLLESARESWDSDYKQCELHELGEMRLQWDDDEGEFPGNFSTFDEYLENSNLEEQINDYINRYCYPDLELKIPSPQVMNRGAGH
jgi:hypothetical protein